MMAIPAKPFRFLLLIATLFVGLSPGSPSPAKAQDPLPSSVYSGRGVQAPIAAPLAIAASSPIPCTGGENVLLIQDNVPWFAAANQHPLGANVTELRARNETFCIATSSEIGSVNLAQFSDIVISAAQTQAFYNNLLPSGVIHPRISQYVQNGGILSANLTDCASGPGAGGTWATQPCAATAATSFTFVGGVKHVHDFPDNNNIGASGHPIITGQFGGANGGRIVDVSCFNDLDCWSISSHAYFINLPVGTTNILVDPFGRPVMVEYPFGNGKVVASNTTTEWRYAGGFGTFPQNRKLLANEIGYQVSLTDRINLPQDFKQNRDGWAGDRLNPNHPEFGCGTMAGIGCAVTATADVLSYYGARVDGAAVDPGNLNRWLSTQRDGFCGCNINWNVVGLLTNSKVDVYFPDISWDVRRQHINSALAQREPVIVSVQVPGESGLHFVVIVGNAGTPNNPDYIIVDPLRTSGRPLSQSAYGTVQSLVQRGYLQVVIIHKPGTRSQRGWNVCGRSPIELFITDPNGLQTGFDSATGTYVQNIPSSVYGVQGGMADDAGGGLPLPTSSYFHQNDPSDGIYMIQVLGVGQGTYHLDLSLRAGSGTPVFQTIAGVTVQGAIDTYVVSLSSIPGQPPVNVQRRVQIDIKPGEDKPASINPRSRGVIPVAILTTPTFDATTVDPLSVKFGPGQATETHNRGHIEDVNGDGRPDLMLHFETQESGIRAGDTQACLTAKTTSGLDIQGCEAIRTVPAGG